MTITHEELLARIALPWIEIVPARKKLTKRSLPANFNEPSPNVVVAALPTDTTSLDVVSQFRQRHFKPRFDVAHIPTDYAWQLVTPAGERLLLFTWANWRRNSRALFEKFCRDTNRTFGTLSHDGSIDLGGRSLLFRDCRIVHEDELRSRPPKVTKPKSGKAVLAMAENLLKQRKSRHEVIDCREFFSDVEAHDDELQTSLEENFLANFQKYERSVTGRYGSPGTNGNNDHPGIPHCGVLRYAIWTIDGQSLYLALTHEDRELPFLIVMGVSDR